MTDKCVTLPYSFINIKTLSCSTSAWESSCVILINLISLLDIPCRCNIFIILSINTIKCMLEIYRQYICLLYSYTFSVICLNICLSSIAPLFDLNPFGWSILFSVYSVSLLLIMLDSTLYIQLKSVFPL